MKGVVSKVAWAKREKGGEYKVRLERDESQDTSHNWKNERAYDPLMVEYSKRRGENLGEKFKERTYLGKVEKANYTDKPSNNIG